MFQAFCISEDNNKDTYKIGSYKIVPKKWMIAYLLDWAHKSIKSHLKTREMGEYLSNKLNVFWPKMYEECERYCKDWESCQMFTKIKKRKRIVKYIRSNAWFERYQADTVKLDSRITHNHAYPYLLTIVDHFSKYGFAYAIRDKKAETIRNYLAQAFVIGEPQMLHTDNGKEFVNELLTNWLEKRNIKHILGGKYHPQSQGAVESFNKTIQKFLNEAYTNSMFNGDEEWSLPLMVSDFLHYYNNKRVHSTTKMIPREILFNFKIKSIVDQVIMNTENSRKAFLQEIDFEVGDSVLLTSWMTQLPNKRIRSFKREKPMKGTKGERQEIHSIQAEIIKKGLYYCIVEVKKIKIPSKIFFINDKIKVTYECIIKVT